MTERENTIQPLTPFRLSMLVENSTLTEKGRHLVEFIEAQYRQYDKPGAEANIPALNSLSGPIAEYWINVEKLKSLSPARWMESFPQSARNAYDIMTYVEEKAAEEAQQQAAIAESVSKTSQLEAQLVELKVLLESKVADLEKTNARLLAENAALTEAVKPAPAKPAKKTGKVAKVTESEETPVEEPAKPDDEDKAEPDADASTTETDAAEETSEG